MKKLPTIEVSYAVLQDMATAPIRSRLLTAGLELGVFDEMNDYRSADDIAAAVGSHVGNTGRFLDALTTIGLVEKRNGLYRNRPELAPFLVKHAPTFIGGMLQLMERMCIEPLDGLVDLVKGGPPTGTYNEDFSSPELWAQATRASAAWVTGGAGTQMAKIVAGLPEFAGFRRMLDLGGGHGMFALYFVDAHPEMTGVVFDRPVVAAVANEFIEEYGLQERVSVKEGDYLTDDIGTEYDLIWACSTLNFARHDLDTLIGKVHDALNPGGVFIAFQDGMTHERTQPDTMLGHLGDALRSVQDFSFDQGEIAASMLRCGFRSVQSQTIHTPMGAMDLDIARKDR
ncbi:methyltransferase [uncultured Desulfosarcina sp.]|uniref:methyltransferase n=1 Tax=uncultured Desulfosarcina sp. TaxID=218289 RepID=UPI0029C8E5A8|nr:methyltransferase [uncultured Desulfosarcina sp.]